MDPGSKTIEQVTRCIRSLRGEQVLLSPDLAHLYAVEPRELVQAVVRNRARFPADFMFQLDKEEWENLKSQFVISSWGGARRLPYAFTEQLVSASECSAYDCEYVALAQELRAPLVTWDRAVVRQFPKVAVSPKGFLQGESCNDEVSALTTPGARNIG